MQWRFENSDDGLSLSFFCVSPLLGKIFSFGRDIISLNEPPKMLEDCILVTAGTDIQILDVICNHVPSLQQK